MGIVSFYKNMVRGNYEMGRHLTDMITRNMEPEKARRLGGAIDTVAGAAITYFFGLATLGYIAAGATALAGILTLSAPATIPAALLTIGGSLLFGGMSGLMTGMGFGFLSAAKEKIHIPSPKAAVVGVGHAAGHVGHEVAKPFKWVGHKLGGVFKRAHDDGKKNPPDDPPPPEGGRPKPGRHQL